MRATRLILTGLMAAAGLMLWHPAALAHEGTKQRAEVTSTERIDFASGGVIELRESYGEVHIEGWDRPEVEITVTKATRKKYAAADQARGLAKLEDVQVELARGAKGGLLITTRFPSRAPWRLFKGKTGLDLVYRLRVPQRSTLFIKHDAGDISVTNVRGDIEIDNWYGVVSLKLPEDGHYTIDARSRIGSVSSDFEAKKERRLLVGEQVANDYRRRTAHLLLRVGIGEIAINKLAQE